MKLRTSSSQEEGADRAFSITTSHLIGEGGQVRALACTQNGVARELPADLVLLAMGFVGPGEAPVLAQADVELTTRGTVRAATTDYRTSDPRVFSCGDMRRGQSLVVWAIREGRDCAASIDRVLASALKG
jgi:glutamate synthase (NADPH/NADH) small chain